MRAARLFVGALLLGACSEPGAVDPCHWPPASGADGWPVVDAGPFVMRVPPGLEEQRASGAGYVGLWAGHNRALAFDYGPMAPDPRGRATGGEEGWSCEAEVGGRAAIVWVGTRAVQLTPGSWQRHAVAEAWWRDGGPDSARLLVMGWGAEADSQVVAREALTAARTVRFRTVWTAGDSLRQLHRFCADLRGRAQRSEAYRPAWEEWRDRCPTGAAPPPVGYEEVR